MESNYVSNIQIEPPPLVTICIPVYNGEKTIERTLNSLINQSYKNIEIIVVDNLSTDSTQKIVEKSQDPRVRFIQNGIHFETGEDNWNTCFRYANGEYMALFHADDVYEPDIIFQQIKMFSHNPQIVAVFTEGNIINIDDEIIGELIIPKNLRRYQVFDFRTVFISILENNNFLICPTAMVKTRLYKKLSPFLYEQFKSASDVDMWLRILENGPIAIIQKKLINYRYSDTQGSTVLNQNRTTPADVYKVIESHLLKINFKIPKISYYNYIFLKFSDYLYCAYNYSARGDYGNARKLLIQGVRKYNFISVLIACNNPKRVYLSVIRPVVKTIYNCFFLSNLNYKQ
jgi:glycosyltransferase involved in cell wall biosynthesis